MSSVEQFVIIVGVDRDFMSEPFAHLTRFGCANISRAHWRSGAELF